jgi:membrane-associated phospholipid phosphatase
VPAAVLPERGQGERRSWNPEWRRFGTADYVLSGGSLALTGVAAAWSPSKNRWRRHVAFDETVRRQLSVKSYVNTQRAQDASDLLLSLSIANPALFQALIVTYWYRRSEDVAGQMLLVTLESLSITAGVQGTTAALANRERPYGRDCDGSIPTELEDCASTRRYRSFFSGHTSMAFAAATTACGFQFRHEVFGNAAANTVACGGALLTAAAVGTLRVVGTQHYATDVLTGAGVGSLIGLGVPWLLHYGPLAESGRSSGVRWSLVAVSNGLGVGGEF